MTTGGPRRMARVFHALSLGIGLVGLPMALGLAEEMRLDRTAPTHLKSLPGKSVPLDTPSRRPPAWTTRHLVYRMTEAELAAVAPEDATLSRLCRLGAFGQQLDGSLYAATDQHAWGVGFANGANLHDPQQRRQLDRVYFFRNVGTADCRVRVGRQARLTRFGHPPGVSAATGPQSPPRTR